MKCPRCEFENRWQSHSVPCGPNVMRPPSSANSVISEIIGSRFYDSFAKRFLSWLRTLGRSWTGSPLRFDSSIALIVSVMGKAL